jgi:addiction module RelB/DinJ family antitoxin
MMKESRMNTTLTVRIDDGLKSEFSRIVESLGLDAPTAVRMLVTQTVRDHALPLSLTQSRPTDTTLDFLDTVRADWGEW